LAKKINFETLAQAEEADSRSTSFWARRSAKNFLIQLEEELPERS